MKITAAGDLEIKARAFDVEALVAQARSSRPDLLSRRRAVESANARVDLAKANRWVDVTLNVGWQHSFKTSATGAFPGPAFDALAATMSVPLPLSKVYRGELDAALATESQGRATVQAVELKIDVEVRQAALRYKAAAVTSLAAEGSARAGPPAQACRPRGGPRRGAPGGAAAGRGALATQAQARRGRAGASARAWCHRPG